MVDIQSSRRPTSSSFEISPINQRECRYVCQIVVSGRPTDLEFSCHALINFQERRHSDIRAILPIQQSCLLATIFSIGSILNDVYREEL
eukprot:7934847-Ditylum_brightwellii.AAC.1